MVQIDPGVYYFLCVLILYVPINWLIAALFAAIIHELCHIIAIYILGGSIRKIQIGVGGAVIETDITGKWRELICALAGPAGSMLLLYLGHIFPKVAIIAFFQGCLNLIPVYPLDGGRTLKCFLELILPEYAEEILAVTEKITYLTVFVCSLFLSMKFSLGVLPVFMAALLIIKFILRKRPCKRSQIGVQ